MSESRTSRRPSALRAVEPRDDGPVHPVEHELGRLLRSETFQQADRLKRFLTFVVRETIAGRGSELKEYVIGVQVFRKEDSFDPRVDPIVRVQARRLRAKLDRYYASEGRADPIVIELPKGGYTPAVRRRGEPATDGRSGRDARPGRTSIVVQPFVDHSHDGAIAGFCEGIREEVLHLLTRMPGLRILAAAPGTPGGETTALPLEATLTIGGSVRESGGRVRIRVHLLHADTGAYAWSESIDGRLDDAFSAQEQVARTVAERLQPMIGDHTAPDRRPIENLAARNLYLQGRYHLNQRTEEGLTKALDFFEKALAEDAQYALAHSGLADAFGLLTHYGVRAPADVWAKAAASAMSAVMLDGLSAEAHTSVAHVKATQDWDWVGAEREYQRAIALDPRYPTVHHWYAASCLAPLGRLDQALEEIRIAQSLDPVSSIIARDVAMVHYYRRDFDAALEQCDHTIELNPHFAPAYWLLGLIQEQRRDIDEAFAAFQRALHLSPHTPRMHGALARTFALSGRKRQALQIFRKLEAYRDERYVSPLEFAWIQFAIGDLDAGFRWLEQACDDRSFDLISMKVDPRFDPLRDDGRFAAILRRSGLE